MGGRGCCMYKHAVGKNESLDSWRLAQIFPDGGWNQPEDEEEREARLEALLEEPRVKEIFDRMKPLDKQAAIKLMTGSRLTDSGCLEWQYGKYDKQGYGKIYLEGYGVSITTT